MNPVKSCLAAPLVARFSMKEENKLKLTIETRNAGDVLIVHCEGSFVYRDETSDFARMVSDMFQHTSRVVVDLSDVTVADGAGLGEFALVQREASARGAKVCFAAPNETLRWLLALTNLDSVLEIRDTVAEALEFVQPAGVTADC